MKAVPGSGARSGAANGSGGDVRGAGAGLALRPPQAAGDAAIAVEQAERRLEEARAELDAERAAHRRTEQCGPAPCVVCGTCTHCSHVLACSMHGPEGHSAPYGALLLLLSACRVEWGSCMGTTVDLADSWGICGCAPMCLPPHPSVFDSAMAG